MVRTRRYVAGAHLKRTSRSSGPRWRSKGRQPSILARCMTSRSDGASAAVRAGAAGVPGPGLIDSKRKVSSEGDDGNRPAVDRGKARSEDLMAMDDGFQALLEGSDVEKARDSPSERYVVGGARRL